MLPAPATATAARPRRPHARPNVRRRAHALRNQPLAQRREAAAFARTIGLFTAAVVVVGLFHVWIAAQARDLDYDRMATLQVVRRLEREARDLEAKIEALNRHDRIERIARNQLGMVRPGAGQKRVLP